MIFQSTICLRFSSNLRSLFTSDQGDGDKTADKGSALSKSIAMQARQAGAPLNKGKPDKLLSSDLRGNDDKLLGYHQISARDLETEG